MALKKTLTTPYAISGTVATMEVDSFAFDISEQLIHIGYKIMEADGTVLQRDRPHTLSGQEYTDFIARLAVLDNTMPATQAIVTACLEALPGAGTVS